MANEKEIWEIELDIKANKLTEINLKYEQSLQKVKEGEKRLTDSLKAENKQKTADKLSELRVTEAMIKQSLDKELLIIKNNNAQEMQLMRQADAEKRRLRAQSDAQLKAQSKLDSKFTGQSTTLGSIGAVNEQIKYFRGLRDAAANNTTQFGIYTQKVKDLQLQKNQLVGSTAKLTDSIKTYGIGLVGVTGLQQLFNLSLESARFETQRANFQGTTADIELFRIATAGTVDDGSLIKLSNQASDLGIGLKEQAVLFSLSEDAADKYGTSVEEGFQKVVFATEGSTKGLKALGIQKGQFEETVKAMTKALQDEGKTIDAETEKQIKLQAILKLSGVTIDDVKNKVQDSADKHEQFLVVAKNLGLYYGGDFFNAVTGVGTAYKLLTEGVSILSDVLNAQKGIIMSSVSAWESVTAQIPIVGDAISWLADRYRDLFNAQSQTAIKPFVDAGADFIDAYDPNGIPPVIRSGNNANTKTIKTGSRGSGTSRTTEEKNAIDELIKSVNLELDIKRLLGQMNLKLLTDQQAILQAADSENLKLEDRKKLLEEIEKVQGRIATWLTAGTRGINETDALTIPYQRGNIGKKRFGTGYDPLNDPDNTAADIQALLDAELKKQEANLGYVNGMYSNFKGMLDATGLMKGEFAQIIGMIDTLINAGSSAFGFFDAIGGLLGFIPGGGAVSSVIGGLSGGGGGGNMPRIGSNPLVTPRQNVRNFTMPSKGIIFGGTVIVESQVEKAKSVNFYQGTLPDYTRRQEVKSLS